MRVIFWSAVFWPHIGGVQILARHLLPALAQRGHEVIVIADQDPPNLAAEEIRDGIIVHRFPLSRGLRDVDHLCMVRRDVLRLRGEFGPDLCHTVALGATDFYQRITNDEARPTPLLVSLFGQWPPRYAALLRETLRCADWIACDSQSTMEYSRFASPDAQASRSIIRNAVEVPGITPAPPPAIPRLLVAGRLSTEKGVDLALRAFSSVVKRIPRAQLIIAGDGPERPALEALAAELGVDSDVEFHGWVDPDGIPDLINRASMLILPSRADSFPLVGLQAALMERPVIAARVGGIPEMVVHERTGLLVKPGCADALASAVLHLITNPERAASMGRAARLLVRKRHRFPSLVAAYDALYRRIVNERRSKGR